MTPRFLAHLALVLLPISHLPLRAQSTEHAGSETPAVEESREEPQAAVEEELIITATRFEASVDTIGSSVSLIGLEEIEARKKTSVLELLRTVPGLEITQSGGPGTTATAFLRGAGSEQTLVLIDDIRANSVTAGPADLSNIRADNIERIEIVRGPQSTLYGSEAMGGIINILTRQGAGKAQRAMSLEAGNDDFFSGRLSAGGGNPLVDYDSAVSYQSTSGVSAASERAGNSEADGFNNLTASGRLGFDFLESGRADLTLRYTDSESELDGFVFGVGPSDDLNYLSTRESLFATLKLSKPVTDWWTQTLILGVADDDLTGTDPDTPLNNFKVESRTAEITLLADLEPFANDLLSLGYTAERRAGANPGSFDQTVDLSSFFLQNQWSWNSPLYFTVGARNDDHSQFGNQTTYRGNLALIASGGRTRVHASYGTGFRAPSLNELYFPFFGNIDLTPETSRGFDLGFEKTLREGRVTLDVTYFYNTFDDLIAFDSATFLANNIAAAKTSGLETTLRVDSGRYVDLSVSYTYLDTENKATGDALPRRPEHRGVISLTFRPTEPLSGVLSLVAVRDRIESDGSPMDDYERLDLSLSYHLNERWTPYLRVENLLDEYYEEVNGFTSPGFAAVAGVNLDF